ncbi:L-histidine N(alpha)-methyltransferase [Catellatospora bangladeshensis]|uniref:Histidine N-alpha-methyltransferase n=1 Tax=Catellatospora bangladeshensis TaxID=310355 RepID=A0A8J3JS52_9ACTN|nr:L-histidine N(alpha)-methyltransferase [Catellatospora bangladeshensis]GIF84135.1 histidine N-alpha-methyltransferase [Catellatospora bangladeshensis]
MKLDVYLTPDDLSEQLRVDAREGLTAKPKWLPPKWFYDAYGSDLFERITKLPEYYPTRAERAVLAAHAADIAHETGVKTLVELGSGSSDKTRLLLDAMHEEGTLARFVPLDVSETALRSAAKAIDSDYPELEVHGIVGDFSHDLDRIPGGGGRMIVFLGGTIGNLAPAERAAFLAEVRDVLGEGEWLLLGTDLVKDPQTLVAAYDDADGVTAEFNLNVLRVLNRSLGADFDLTAFEHVAVWDPRHSWIEMRLRALRDMTVEVPALELEVGFRAGEEIRTEISAKFDRHRVEAELAKAGFAAEHWWTDPQGRFAVTLARAVE